jgi:hypothetical protein
MKSETEKFPMFFRKAGTIIRRDSPTTGVVIRIPEPHRHRPNSLDDCTYPTRERFDEYLIDFEITDAEKYDEFLRTYFSNAIYMDSLYKMKRNPQLTIEQQ